MTYLWLLAGVLGALWMVLGYWTRRWPTPPSLDWHHPQRDAQGRRVSDHAREG